MNLDGHAYTFAKPRLTSSLGKCCHCSSILCACSSLEILSPQDPWKRRAWSTDYTWLGIADGAIVVVMLVMYFKATPNWFSISRPLIHCTGVLAGGNSQYSLYMFLCLDAVTTYFALVKVTQGKTVISHVKIVQGRIDLDQHRSYTDQWRCNSGFVPARGFVLPGTNPLAYLFRFSENSADLFLVVAT